MSRRPEPPLLPLLRPDVESVLIVSGCEGATRRYRCMHQAEQLRLRGIPVRVVSHAVHDIVDEGLGHGIVILHRVAWDDRVQALIDRTRDAGGFVLFDIDDLVFEPESTHHHHGVTHLTPDEQTLYHDGVRRYRRTLLACDGTLVPTRFLAERVRALGRPAWISRNCIDLELARRSTLASEAEARAETRAKAIMADGVIIGYASGSRTHDRDFAEAAGPAVLRIMSRRPDVLLHVIGPLSLGPEWSAFEERILRVPAVDWRALPSEIAHFDISLAPLEIDNPFCMAKSELKWLEASACGVPSVAVATEAFATAIREGETGLLASDADGWERAIESLVDDGDARRAMGAAAAAAVLGHRTTDAQAAAFESTLAEARAALRPESVAPLRSDARSARALTISFVVPEPPKGSGGHASIFRMIAALDRAGHAVTVHIKPGPLMQGEREAEAAAFIRANFPRSGARITLSPEIGRCDVVIATSWTTALDARYAPATTKLYFVQDFEPYFQPISADYLAGESTYQLGLGHITLGPWLAELLRDQYGARAAPIDFGVEHEIYLPDAEVERSAAVAGSAPGSESTVVGGPGAIDGPAPITDPSSSTKPDVPRVVFYGRGSTPRRGVPLGLEALGMVKAARPEVEVVLYGGATPGMADFPYVDAGILTQAELAALYRSATVGLALSYTNLSFVPLEMAACGLPVVAVETDPAAWYQVDGETCVVADPTAESVAEGILRVIDDAALRRRLVEGGLHRVSELSWERSTAQFVRHVERYVAADREGAFDLDESLGDSYGDSSTRRAQLELPALHPVMDILDDGHSEALGAGEVSTDAIAQPIADAVEWNFSVEVNGLHRLDVRLAADRRAADRYVRLSLRGAVSGDAATDEPAVAESIVRASLVLDGEWSHFEFPPIADSAGRSYRARLEVLAAIESTGLPAAHLIEVTLGSRGVPAHRTFGLDNYSVIDARRAEAHDPPATDGSAAIHDPALFERLHSRRRSLAFHRGRYNALRRHRGLMTAIDLWRRWTDPLPPGDHRPWPDSAPEAIKLLLGLLHYGPIRVAREIAAARRWKAGVRPSSMDAVGVAERITKRRAEHMAGFEHLDPEHSPPMVLDDAPALAHFAMGDDYLLAERALRAPVRPIFTLGPWLARWVAARHGAHVDAELPYPVDRAVFSAGPPAGERDPIIALDIGICRQRSSAVLGLRVLEILARNVSGVRAVVFSSRPLPQAPDVELSLGPSAEAAGLRWVGFLEPHERADLLRETAVLVVPAFSNPPLEMVEAIACGCVIAAPEVISTAWLLKNGRTAITAPPHADALELRIESALRDRVILGRIARGATGAIEGMTAERSAEVLRDTLAGLDLTASTEQGDDSSGALGWLELRPAEPPHARPILHALRFAEERNAALELAIRAIENTAPARAVSWLNPRPGPLPPAESRPWSPHANTGIKLLKTLRHYGPVAFAREVRDGVRWRWMTKNRSARFWDS